jgi:hypothetical protein
MDSKCFDRIEGAVVMSRSTIEEFGTGRNRRFHWESILPKRKAWIQSLILLPFGLPVASFLAASWQFSVNEIVSDRQYVIGVLSMAVNLLLPSLFFAVVFHWGWLMWRQAEPTWYPKAKALWAGASATLIIAVSFGMVGLFTRSLGICGNPVWGWIGANFLCNFDGYGFESRSWFGAWSIVAAYCYQVQDSIESGYRRIRHRRDTADRFAVGEDRLPDLTDLSAVATAHDDLRSHPTNDTITNNSED